MTHGWAPMVAQAIAAGTLLYATGWRTRRWRGLWLPVALVIGAVTAAWAHHYLDSLGIAGDPAPVTLWIWLALIGVALAVLIAGWPRSNWRRRAASVAAVPLCVFSSGLALNCWVGYFPTVHAAWNQLTAGPLPDQTDRLAVTAMQVAGKVPANGVVVPVTISASASKFEHRGELVYLPPAWFASNPPPRLPVVMMIGSALNTPADWVRAGGAVETIDRFAADHGGSAPVLVFVDATGAFNNDTECVNGLRGNAADHLVKDVVPFMVSNFGVAKDAAEWGITGWSMGGTCAVDLTMMHPDMFSAFVDIAGDLGPNVGTAGRRDQTVARLFGGDETAWAAFDPTTVIAKHGPYTSVSGWFEIPSSRPGQQRNVADTESTPDQASNPEGQDVAAATLSAIARRHGVTSAVVASPGRHDWPFAAAAFADALPWLAGQLSTPGVPRVGFPTPASELAAGEEVAGN